MSHLMQAQGFLPGVQLPVANEPPVAPPAAGVLLLTPQGLERVIRRCEESGVLNARQGLAAHVDAGRIRVVAS